MSVNKFIEVCFQIGFSNYEILALLAYSQKIIISLSTLKRRLKSMHLFRRKNHSDVAEVALFISKQQEESGSLNGYRWMYLKCVQSGFRVPRDTVYELMKILDPTGLKSRLRKRLKRRKYYSPGPNFVWHMDGYDKLKPYGIAIHGCIDGYSRYIIWLEAGSTNNDPKVIAGYYMNAVKERSGCPKRLRADYGTENVYVEYMQKFMRSHHEDEFFGEKSYVSGRSTQNQRIEWFWGLLRKEMGQFYMDIFSDFAKDGTDLFSGDLLDKNLIQFCFMKIIQANLDEVRNTWNTHRLQANHTVGGGEKPILLYSLPGLYGVVDHICGADENKMMVCDEQTTPKLSPCADETVSELCELLEGHDLSIPSTTEDAIGLYEHLRRRIHREIGAQNGL